MNLLPARLTKLLLLTALLGAHIPPLHAATYTWDGSTNTWNSVHWNPGPIAGGNNTNDTYVVGAGEVSFSVNDTFGIHSTLGTPAVRIDAGGVISSGAKFTTFIGLTLNGGTLHAKGGVNSPYGAFGLKGTTRVTGSTPSSILGSTAAFSTISVGSTTAGGVTTFEVEDVTADAAVDLQVGAVLNNLGNVVSGIVKTGPGTLSITTNLLNTGVNRVEAGVLRIGGPSPVSLAGGVTTRTGGALELTGVVNQGAGQIFATGNGLAATTGTTRIRPGAVVSVGSNAVLIGGGTAGNGQFGKGLLSIEAGGELVVGPGVSTSGGSDATSIWLNPYGTSTNSVLQVSGTLRTARSILNGSGAQSEVHADGGNIQFTADARTINVSRLFVRNGGLQLDTQGFAISIAAPLLHSPLAGDSAIDGGFYKTGSGTLTLTSNGGTFTGNVYIGAGTVALNSGTVGFNAVNGPLGNPQVAGRTITVGAGATLRFQNHDAFGNASTTPLVKLVAEGGTLVTDSRLITLGDVELNGATMTANGGVVFSGSNIGSWQLNGTVTVSGSAPSAMNTTGLPGSRVLLRITGGATTFNVADVTGSEAADLVVSTPMANGWNGVSAGITKSGSGSMVLTATNLYTGVTDVVAGTLVVDGAVINTGARMDIGLNASTPAHYRQTAGTVTVGSQFVIGAHGSTGTATLAGGSLQVNGTLYIGGYGEGTGTGTLTQTGGTVTATGGVNFGGGGPNHGVYELTGGVLSTTIVGKNGGGNAHVLFNGGTLRARAATPTFLQGLSSATVKGGGAILDSAGFDITIAQPLLHDPALGGTPDGGLRKLGDGVLALTGSFTFTGNTGVSNGTLRIEFPNLSTTSAVALGPGAKLDLAFSGTNTVQSLSIGGLPMPAGTYGSSAADAQFVDPGHFPGTGVLKVLTSNATPYTLWAQSAGLDGTPGRENGPTQDPDLDGTDNRTEFALGGDPLDPADRGLFAVRTEDTAFDADALGELTLTLELRAGAVFSASGPELTAAVDGVRYHIDGSLVLPVFTSTVHEVSPALGSEPISSGYERRTFRLEASNGSDGPGYLRVRVGDP